MGTTGKTLALNCRTIRKNSVMFSFWLWHYWNVLECIGMYWKSQSKWCSPFNCGTIEIYWKDNVHLLIVVHCAAWNCRTMVSRAGSMYLSKKSNLLIHKLYFFINFKTCWKSAIDIKNWLHRYIFFIKLLGLWEIRQICLLRGISLVISSRAYSTFIPQKCCHKCVNNIPLSHELKF